MGKMDSFERLKDLFRELFQLDVADLDFGLYRLFRLKRGEVEAFLNEQLPVEIDRALEAATGAEREALERQVEEQARQVRTSVADDAVLPSGEANPKYAEIKAVKEYVDVRKRLEAVEASEAQRAEVFNLLYAFFSRYYDEGDFIPRRFFGARAAYAVPYNGQELFFHWANKDQYYVKSGEAFRDYAFTVPTVSGEYQLRFRLVEASTPKDNTKGDTRFFFPQPKRLSFDPETRICIVPFEYRLPTAAEVAKYGKNAKGQEAILDESAPKILQAVPDILLQAALTVPSPTGREGDGEQPPTLLRRRLNHFTTKQTTDYFVHKNLGAFLRQELEFFLRDQVVHELDLEGDFDAKRRILRVFRTLADTIITFLSQIEDAQKRLFEKRKFVLRTNYLVPIQHVPRALWPEVLANQAQLSEWRELFALEPKSDLFHIDRQVDEYVLEQHPTLVVDTRHFSSDFTVRLLEALPDLDEWTDGVLVHGENFQALRLLDRQYRGRVECLYIDPPYNTGDSEIPYKNGYLFSSWLALMENRLTNTMGLLTDDPVLFIAIDDFEMADLCQLIDRQFPFLRREMIIVNHHPQGGKAKTLATTHEYMIACTRRDSDRTFAGRTSEDGMERRPFKRSGTAESNFRRARPNSFYAILVDPETKKVVGIEEPPEGLYPTGNTDGGLLRVYPLGERGEERVWRRSYESALQLVREGKLQCSDGLTIYQLIEAGEKTPALFSNWVDPRYNAGTFGANLLGDIIGTHNPFSYPKSIHTVGDALFAAGLADDTVCLDYFAGSGTTGHAVINLNREDGARRKFILVEMADYFDSVLVPRIKKVMFSPEWKDGKPKRPATKQEAERTPRLVKVLRLESYEDALHNTFSEHTIDRLTKREKAYREAVGDEHYRVRYLVKLPLEVSDSMLNLAKLEHPFDYTLEILTDHGPQTETVDVVETLNWLYGLRVHRLLTWVNPDDATKREPTGRLYRAVVATDREDKKRILVVWRDTTNLDPMKDRAILETKAKELGPFEEQWVNADSAAKGFASLDGLFKRLMEEGVR
ncbi:MAG: DNA methyltransferase [Bacillota bacterium]